MAEQLGAVLALTVDDSAFTAGLNQAVSQAQAKGRQIEKALEARQGRIDQNQAQILRLQKEALSADASRASLIRQQIGYLQQENRVQQAGIATLREKLALNAQLTKNIQAQAAAGAGARGAALQGAGSFLSGLTGFGGISAIGGGIAAAGFLKGSIDSAVELESITKKLSNTLGPNGTAGALSFTKGLSDQLGLSFTTLASSFSSFTAAATAANVPLQTQKDLFAAVSKAAQALGLSNDEIGGSLLALQQIASKGTVQMEELRGQLGERLPIAFGAAAIGLGKTQKELIALIEAGKLTSQEFFPALTKGLNQLTAASGGAPTTAQNFQLLANAWKDLQTEFGTNLLPGVTEGVKGLTGFLQGVGVVGRASKLGLGGGLSAPIPGLPIYAPSSWLGQIPEQGAQAVGALKALQQQFNLTEKQANALFTDAVKQAGGKLSPILGLQINDKQFEDALNRLIPLATEFRKRNGDTTAELKAQQAIMGQLVELTTKKAVAQSQDAASIKAARQAIDQARTNEAKAVGLYLNLQKTGVKPVVLQQAAEVVDKAGQNLLAALKTGANTIAEIINSAAERLTNARLGLAELRNQSDQGLNKYLSPDDVARRRNLAARSLAPELETSIKQAQSILGAQGTSLPNRTVKELRSFLNDAKGLRPTVGTINGVAIRSSARTSISEEGLNKVVAFIRDTQQERSAIRDVNVAGRSMEEINAELASVNSDLATAVQSLANKDWSVVVNVAGSGASVSGDVLNRAMSQ